METFHADRLWDNYLVKTKAFKIPQKPARWYIKHVENFLRINPDLSFTQLSAQHVETYFKNLGRNSRLQDWQFKQAVDALRILFVDLISSQCTTEFPWDYWAESSSDLPRNHATVARDHLPLPNQEPTHSQFQKMYIVVKKLQMTVIWLRKSRSYFLNMFVS